jgi:hypothetical protein
MQTFNHRGLEIELIMNDPSLLFDANKLGYGTAKVRDSTIIPKSNGAKSA